jgi:hypothetical protein
VVLVERTRETRKGSSVPAGTPENKTVEPFAIITEIFPAPPIQRARETLVKSVESDGVTASAMDAGDVVPTMFVTKLSVAGMIGSSFGKLYLFSVGFVYCRFFAVTGNAKALEVVWIKPSTSIIYWSYVVHLICAIPATSAEWVCCQFPFPKFLPSVVVSPFRCGKIPGRFPALRAWIPMDVPALNHAYALPAIRMQ